MPEQEVLDIISFKAEASITYSLVAFGFALVKLSIHRSATLRSIGLPTDSLNTPATETLSVVASDPLGCAGEGSRCDICWSLQLKTTKTTDITKVPTIDLWRVITFFS